MSKRVRWDIDRDVIRGRSFDFAKRFLPDGLSKVDRLDFLTANEQRLLSQIQGRTYANMFGLVERFIAAKVLDVSREHALGDQNALQALVRFGDEEIKHQELFRRIERMCAERHAGGLHVRAGAQCRRVGGALEVHVGRARAHLPHRALRAGALSREHRHGRRICRELWKDVFLYHAKEESQHAILDEMEWVRENAKLTSQARDAAVDDLIALVGAVDGILQVQSAADTHYFVADLRPAADRGRGRSRQDDRARRVSLAVHRLGRRRSRVSRQALGGMITESQARAHRRRAGADHGRSLNGESSRSRTPWNCTPAVPRCRTPRR